MAKSKIVFTFTNWESGNPTGTTLSWDHNGTDYAMQAVVARFNSYQFNVAGDSPTAAWNFWQACQTDFIGIYTATRAGNTVTLTAVADNVVISDFLCSIPGRASAVITNEVVPVLLDITGYSLHSAPTNKCSTIDVWMTAVNGTPPYIWVTPATGYTGLTGIIPRTGGDTTITLEDSDGEQDSIIVQTPAIFNNTVLSSIGIVGDPSGLYGSVSVYMNPTTGVPLVFEYSMDNTNWQSGNTFTSVLPGVYTMYIRDQYGCVISQEFEVTLTTIRPPVYRAVPKSNSFGWFETQAPVVDCTNPYNTTNAKPNDWKPTRFYNPKYFQPWCTADSVITQFRSNYDTLVATLWDIINDVDTGVPLEISKVSNNIGQRQLMDAIIYDRGSSQTGIYWLTGNIYDTDKVTVIGTYDLGGQLPEWVKVGQKFFLSGSAGDGLFEIKQIIFDSILLVNAAVIDRIYTDVTETVNAKVDATYNRLNYETYEFITPFSSLSQGCYRVNLSMTDSLDEYPDSLWETLPFKIVGANRDLIYIESSDHVDDGILYSTGIVHKQRFTGLFYEQDFPSTYEVSRDSRKEVNKLDGRVESVVVLEAIDIPFWVHEKLALFVSKRSIRVNNLAIQNVEPFERERAPTYGRVNLKTEATVEGYEQYMTNAYDIL